MWDIFYLRYSHLFALFDFDSIIGRFSQSIVLLIIFFSTIFTYFSSFIVITCRFVLSTLITLISSLTLTKYLNSLNLWYRNDDFDNFDNFMNDFFGFCWMFCLYSSFLHSLQFCNLCKSHSYLVLFYTSDKQYLFVIDKFCKLRFLSFVLYFMYILLYCNYI